MKKYIFIIMILMGIINFGNENYGYVRSSIHNDSVYCIGIGKLTENINDRILSFKARLCRVGEKVFRNVTVNQYLILRDYNDEKFNVKEKMTYYTLGPFDVMYLADSNMLLLEKNTEHPRLFGHEAIFEPVSEMGGLVDIDLIEIYGNTLGLSTDTEEGYVDKFNNSIHNIKFIERN